MSRRQAPLFVNRAERAITATLFLLLLALCLIGVSESQEPGSAAIGWFLTAIAVVALVRSRNRPAVYADDDGVTVKSLLYTRHLRWTAVTGWTAETRLVGAFKRTVLVAHLANGKVKNLGREGVWAEKADEVVALRNTLVERHGRS